MKTIGKLCMALFLIISLVGCSSDDEGGNETSASLVGTWAVTSLDYEGTTSFDFLGETVNTSFDGVGQNLDLNFTFTENPNEYTSEGSYDIVLDFTVNGMSETETTSIDNLQQEGTWERNGNILSIDGEIIDLDIDIPVGDTMGMSDLTILELTDTTLRLGQEVNEEVTQEGITVSVSVSSVIVFARQ
ncbi:lipocalin family protein [uncultured Dokdonia sp.]|uniref:lipocalin family protein n=1 Tax=uncultured Dokdonia sp. TaxID=575653 RepID=UPI00261759C1|nr:lipocalin family protein [uncultured Dokdonia sp.]